MWASVHWRSGRLIILMGLLAFGACSAVEAARARPRSARRAIAARTARKPVVVVTRKHTAAKRPVPVEVEPFRLQPGPIPPLRERFLIDAARGLPPEPEDPDAWVETLPELSKILASKQLPVEFRGGFVSPPAVTAPAEIKVGWREATAGLAASIARVTGWAGGFSRVASAHSNALGPPKEPVVAFIAAGMVPSGGAGGIDPIDGLFASLLLLILGRIMYLMAQRESAV